MKKFFKGMLIGAGVFAAVGIGLTAGGTVMGASLSDLSMFDQVRASAWRVASYLDDHDEDWDSDDFDDFEDAGDAIVGTSSGDGEKRYVIDRLPEKLEIDLRYEILVLEESQDDAMTVTVVNEGTDNVTVKQDDDTLKIKSTREKDEQRYIYLSYPAGTSFRELEIEMSTGGVEFDTDVQTRKLSVEIGAGDFTNNGQIQADEAELSVGVGNLSISGLDASKIEGECGIGSMQMTLAGGHTDYNYKLECGAGVINLGFESYSGLVREKRITNDRASRTMELECGMGEIDVSFVNDH